jgi:hypothetical protein
MSLRVYLTYVICRRLVGKCDGVWYISFHPVAMTHDEA